MTHNLNDHFSISILREDDSPSQLRASVHNMGWDWTNGEWEEMRDVLRMLEGDRCISDAISEAFHINQVDSNGLAHTIGDNMGLDMIFTPHATT